MDLQCSADTVRGYMLKYEKVSVPCDRLLAHLGRTRAQERSYSRVPVFVV
jgi:hypothetical protein